MRTTDVHRLQAQENTPVPQQRQNLYFRDPVVGTGKADRKGMTLDCDNLGCHGVSYRKDVI